MKETDRLVISGINDIILYIDSVPRRLTPYEIINNFNNKTTIINTINSHMDCIVISGNTITSGSNININSPITIDRIHSIDVETKYKTRTYVLKNCNY
jgi:hypothetical protein